MIAAITAAAGAFAASVTYADLPDRARATARLGFTDAMGVLLAGLHEPVTEVVVSYVTSLGGVREAPFLLGERRAPAELSALVDATAIHALDYDDYAFSNHISAVIVPAILAAAALSGADGERMAAAYVAGYEIWADLMVREPDHLHSKGWHPTPLFGPVGAAAAAATTLGLDQQQATTALALAATHAGGLMANFGSMTKPYHAGFAAEAGVRSALMARAGLTAQPNAIEDDRGLLAAVSPAGKVDRETPPRFGDLWRVEKGALNIKKYPTVGASQRSIDAILALTAETAIAPETVVRIRPRVSVKHYAVMPFDDPKVPAEAKFSLPFACAAALLFGRVGLPEVTAERLADPALRRLMAKVEVDAVEDYDPDYPVAAPYDVVTVTLDDGSEHVSPRIRRAGGHADNPLDAAALWDKFAGCAAYGGVPEDRARALFDAAQQIDMLKSVGALRQ